MTYVILPNLISIIFVIMIVIINNLRLDDNKKALIFSISLLCWTLAIFITSYYFMIPTADMQYTPLIIPYSFQYLLIFIFSLCAIFIKTQSVRFLTSSSFLLMFSFVLYLFSIFSYGSGYDGAIMGMLFIFGPATLASVAAGLIIFLFTRRVMKTIYQ